MNKFKIFKLLILFFPILSLSIAQLVNQSTLTQQQPQQQQTNPTLVFYINHQNQQQKDYVQIKLKIQAKDSSLTAAINHAAQTVQEISNMAKQFCNQNTKKKSQCKEIVNAGKFEIQPRYQLIRKEPVFMGFTVQHQMTINVKSVDNIGFLVDKILSNSGITLEKFQWKAQTQPKTHQQAIAQGMQQAQGLCKQLGMKLGKVISIQEMKNDHKQQQEQQQEQGKQNQQQEQKEEQNNQASFRFQVQCVKKQTKQQKTK